ncbi:uncharacterized protein L203_100122 [Cryptococcus depauperatus CBS 7841]|uniref:Uncharacterized protein n=1 Tax=Cryptococcus depauperatus CBS 7841 TaxID=1295531 RepID=A0AAJ8LV95_9TREE
MFVLFFFAVSESSGRGVGRKEASDPVVSKQQKCKKIRPQNQQDGFRSVVRFIASLPRHRTENNVIFLTLADPVDDSFKFPARSTRDKLARPGNKPDKWFSFAY